MDIESLDNLQAKWASQTQANEANWISGYQTPRTDWETAAADAEDRWANAANSDLAEAEFETKVEAVGNDGFLSAMTQYGYQRYGNAFMGERLTETVDRWVSEFWNVYASVIEGEEIPGPENLTPQDYWNQINRNWDNRGRPICHAIHLRHAELVAGE